MTKIFYEKRVQTTTPKYTRKLTIYVYAILTETRYVIKNTKKNSFNYYNKITEQIYTPFANAKSVTGW